MTRGLNKKLSRNLLENLLIFALTVQLLVEASDFQGL